jgi:hypothetical protein
LDVTRFYNKITVIIIKKRLYTEKQRGQYLNSMSEYRTLQTKQTRKPRTLLCEIRSMILFGAVQVQGGSNMTGTNCNLFTHKQSRSYLNHLVHSGSCWATETLRLAPSCRNWRNSEDCAVGLKESFFWNKLMRTKQKTLKKSPVRRFWRH